MVTMKGFTFSLPFLLVLTFSSKGHMQPQTAPNNTEPQRQDYAPTDPRMMLLPTTAGTMTIPQDLTKNAGQLSSIYTTCGKVNADANQQLDLPYTGTKINLDMVLDCYPHPMRVVIKKDKSGVPGPAPSNVDVGSCQGLQACGEQAEMKEINHGDGTSTDLVNMKSTPLNKLAQQDDICRDSPKYILLSNELGCTSSDLVITSVTSNYIVVPRFKTKEDGFFEVLRPFMYNGLGQKKEKPFDRTNSFISFNPSSELKSTHEWRDCSGSCDRGNIVKMNMKQGSWKTTLYVKATTRGFKVCIDADGHDKDNAPLKCRPKFELYVLVQNGVVVWPKTGRASILELKGPSVNDNANAVIAIELGYGYGKNAQGNLAGEFYVGNMYREVAVSDSDGWPKEQASRVSFFFENDDDLSPSGGIYSPYIHSAKTYIGSAKAKDVLNLKPKSNKNGSATDGKEDLTLHKEAPTIPLVGSTTPAPKRLSSNAQAGVLLSGSDYSNDAIFMPGKWWAWGLYIGFIIGSIVGAAIIGAIFYVLRRTVYGFWYRGMYKRYRCDASGTTGGITGVGFGTTTVGAITVGGTTGGGTTAGTTAGTTGSTTGTGGTTGSMTSTGGASTIAM